MTQVTLADKDSTPQVHGPFRLTSANISESFASALTTNVVPAGALITHFWWVPVTTWVADAEVIVSLNNTDAANVMNVHLLDHEFNGASAAPSFGSGVAPRLQASYGGTAPTAGEADFFFLVVPV